MKNLVLYGASPFGDEIVQLFRDINERAPEWKIVGLLDDNPALAGTVRNGVPVLGGRDWLDSADVSNLWAACCIGSASVRESIASMLSGRGCRFARAVHPTVLMSPYVRIGEGSLITAGNILTTNIEIGRHVIVNLCCTIGHAAVLGDFVTVNPGVNISGNVKLDTGCYIGTNATILEKRTVGSYSVVGAGAVVTKDVPPGVTVVGVPARAMKS